MFWRCGFRVTDNGSHHFTVEGGTISPFAILAPNPVPGLLYQTHSIYNNVIVMFQQTKPSTVELLEVLDKVCSPLLPCPFKPTDLFQSLWPYHTSRAVCHHLKPCAGCTSFLYSFLARLLKPPSIWRLYWQDHLSAGLLRLTLTVQ